MPLPFHPSLKKLPQECREWMEHVQKTGDYDRYAAAIEKFLEIPGPLDPKAGLQLDRLGHYFNVATCDAYFRSDIAELDRFLQWTVAIRALVLRWHGMHSEMHPDLGNWPMQFWDSMKAAGPAILSWWDEARVCGKRFLEMAEKDQRINTVAQSRRVADGTNDAFLAFLFSNAFGIPTDFAPQRPVIAEYQALLENWRTTDEAVFVNVMQGAADFHISRSKHSTGSTFYEFDRDIDRLFPGELLAVQALRRRDELPEFKTDHFLIDAPWAIVRDLPQVEPHPLAAAVEARLKRDYPLFR
ncbi:hypothetical protein SAMN03159488_01502 [Pseudomonas sp. NFIX10]|uniref:hypothetical protein n=1 Tax=unclassified Pseudomonas TaxID=196821 RepID=UPI0008E046B5|nr:MULTISPECIES: hypothetical protein [unclassified Pseudomonas]SFB02373.1 hypothetical protein SAMN03159488_01502 [Pseudomonas sp. NFIX10]SFE56930.1 hypothetical protein SAMN03159367_01502 [Pseudomonas sp. NFACC06-1]